MDIEAFDPETVNQRFGEPQTQALKVSIEDALSAAFGHATPTYERYRGAANLDQGPHVARMIGGWGRGPQIDYDAQDLADARKYLAEGKTRSITLLQQCIRTLENRLKEHGELTILCPTSGLIGQIG